MRRNKRTEYYYKQSSGLCQLIWDDGTDDKYCFFVFDSWRSMGNIWPFYMKKEGREICLERMQIEQGNVLVHRLDLMLLNKKMEIDLE